MLRKDYRFDGSEILCKNARSDRSEMFIDSETKKCIFAPEERDVQSVFRS